MKIPTLLMAATFGATILGAAATADAKPNFDPAGPHYKPSKPYNNLHKPYLSQARYQQMRASTRRKAVRDFRRIDRNRDGFITRREYRLRYRTRSSNQYRTRSTLRRNMRSWRILLSKADFNKDRRVSSWEMSTMRLRVFQAHVRANYSMKRKLSYRAYRRMMANHNRHVRRSFVAMDKNRDGILTRRDFRRSRRTYTYEWRWTSNGRRRVRKPVPRRINRRWNSLARTYDTNRDGRITSGEFRSVKLATYRRSLLAKYDIGRRHRRGPRFSSNVSF